MNDVPSPAAQPEAARTKVTPARPWFVALLLSRLRARKVPVYTQLNAVECGAACLAMILSYYGRTSSVGECRDVCGTSRDGASALALVQAARLFGLLARAFSLDIEHIRQLQLPAIVHWNFNHFVVLERWTPETVTIVDPAVGRRRLTPQQFDAGFTGLALTFAPGPQFQRRTQAMPSFWRAYLRPLWAASGLLGAILGTSLLLQLFGLALPAFTKLLIDRVATFQSSDVLVVIGIGMLLVTVTQALTSYVRGVLLTALQARLDAKLMQGFFQHLLSLPFSFFQQRTSGDLLMRLSSTTVIRETLTAQLLAVFLDGPLVLLYLLLLWVYAPLFAGLAIGMGALQIALLLLTIGRVHEVTQRDLLTQSGAQSYFVEVLAGMGVLKASGSEDRALNNWTNLFVKQLNASVQRSRLLALVDSAMQGLRASTPLLCLLVGVQQVHDGRMSLGTMLALNTLVGAFLVPLVSLVSNGRQLQSVRAHMERLADVLRAPAEQAPAQLQSAPSLSGQIVVEKLRFHYDPQALPVLHDISFAVAAGHKIALVGRTGSGKSTLLQLLLGLYPAAGGSIAYDGIPLQRLRYRTLRSQCGVVLQEPFLFSGTIRQNITFNQPSLDLKQAMAAARVAAIHDEIMQLPMGYDTLLAEGGQGLSGGQRQRIALARAIAQHPKVLILDEATSHLDAATEAIVDANISRLSCTRIVVAHRLSTIRNADLILVLEDGTIVERGTHESLLAQNGVYARLIESQSSGLAAEQRKPDL